MYHDQGRLRWTRSRASVYSIFRLASVLALVWWGFAPRPALADTGARSATLVVVQPVSASTPIAVAGTFFFVAAPVPSDFRTADGNTFGTLFLPAVVLPGGILGTLA